MSRDIGLQEDLIVCAGTGKRNSVNGHDLMIDVS